MPKDHKIAAVIAMTNTQKFLVNGLSLFAVAFSIAGIAYLASPLEHRASYSLLSAVVVFMLFPLFNYAVNKAGPARSTPREWFKSALLSGLILGGMLGVDVFLGVYSHPDWPILKSTASNIGFVVTVFVSPVFLSAVFGLIRAIAVKFVAKE